MIWPLGRFSLISAMSVGLSVCLSGNQNLHINLCYRFLYIFYVRLPLLRTLRICLLKWLWNQLGGLGSYAVDSLMPDPLNWPTVHSPPACPFCENVKSLTFTVCEWLCFEFFGSKRMTHPLNYWITNLFVGQPLLHQVCQ